MRPDTLRIHRFEPASRVNGPGLRAVLWVQGCALGCQGCFNPETHSFHAGERWTVEQALETILSVKDKIEGITLSGGEPIHQYRLLARLLNEIRTHSKLSVLVFSGYTWDEMHKLPAIRTFLDQVDVLIAGRYQHEKRVAGGLIGSANKTVHFFTDRYRMSDLEQVPEAEVILTLDGEILLSGIDPLKW